MKKIMNWVSNNPFLVTVFVCLVFYVLPFKPKPFGDGEYHEGTIQLIQYVLNGFQGTVRVDKGLFTLFYYLVPYSFAYIFHSDAVYYFFGVVFNSIITCFAIQYLYKAFNLMQFSYRSKFWVMMVLVSFPIHAYYAMGILAESGSFFSVCLMVYLVVKVEVKNSNLIKDYLFLAFSVVMLIGFRPNLLPIAFLLLAYYLFKNSNWQYKVSFATVLLVFLLILLFTEKSLNLTDGEFKKNEFRKQLVWSRFELRDEPFNWLPQHGQDGFESTDYKNNLAKRRELDSICKTQNLDKTSYFLKWVGSDIIQNPLLTLRQFSFKFFQSQSFIISPLMKSNKSKWIKYGVHVYINSINYLLLFFSMASVVILCKKKKYSLVMPLVLLWGWSLLYVFFFHSEQRYMFPVRPVLIFLFANFINDRFNKKPFSLKESTN